MIARDLDSDCGMRIGQIASLFPNPRNLFLRFNLRDRVRVKAVADKLEHFVWQFVPATVPERGHQVAYHRRIPPCCVEQQTFKIRRNLNIHRGCDC